MDKLQIFRDTLLLCEELELDLVEMSAHEGSCKECARYQGRVFSISGTNKKYPKLPDVVFRYGGIHEGCRHIFSPFCEGSVPVWSDSQLEELYPKDQERSIPMALINCPECNKQISDTTTACPHCGYKLSVEQSPPSPTPTKIGETKTETGSGTVYLAIGIISLLCSLLMLILILPLGILSMIGSIALISTGYRKVSGSQECYCPYCGKLGSIGKSEQAYVCIVCKKRSVRDGEYLKPL